MPAAATRQANQSYREVLRSNRRVAGLLLGDLLANVGTGMILVAMPCRRSPSTATSPRQSRSAGRCHDGL
jgi:hypothetical protein